MITPFLLQALVNQFGGELINGDVECCAVSTDTRQINSGDLFVALVGDQFDAHNFLSKAVTAGACALVVDRTFDDINLPQWVVPDTTIALGHIALYQRERFNGQLIAITGSSGKTTVKGMVASILQAAVANPLTDVFATQGNFNNHIGVPLSLLSLTDQHRYAVIEMGASALGEINYLTHLGQPDVALINNVMPAHIEGFGSLDNIATAKGEIYNGLSEKGVAIINLDDVYAQQWLVQNKERQVITFSLEENSLSDIQLTQVQKNHLGCANFQLHLHDNIYPVQLQVLGFHNVANALAAAACAYALQIEGKAIVKGLSQFNGIPSRLQYLSGLNGSTIIDDSYNANPKAMCAAIDVLADLTLKKVLILGDMGELGDSSVQAHGDVGEYAKNKNIDDLLCVGHYTKESSQRFSASGVHTGLHFESSDQLIAHAKTMADANTVFLIKGSRSSRMDIVVQALTQ